MKRRIFAVIVLLLFGAYLGYRSLNKQTPTAKPATTIKAVPAAPIVLENKPSPAVNPLSNLPAAIISKPTTPPAPATKVVVKPAPTVRPTPATVTPPAETKPAAAASAVAGDCVVPSGAGPEDVSRPTTVVGDGTAEGCTAAKVIDAVKKGGVVTFDCGPDPLTIKVPEIKIYNNGGQGDGSVTIDGGSKITLAAVSANRIIYQNTCDESLVWTSPRCDLQTTPHLVLENINLTGGRGSAGKGSLHDVLGGGAVYVRGGTFKAYNLKVTDSVQTNAAGIVTQDLAGGAVYTFGLAKPATIVNSVFENNSGANGGAIGGLFTSYTIINSTFSNNQATGHGMNPAQAGTTGGGLGGAIYNDGNSYTLNICGSDFTDNTANDLGSGSIFMVANDLKGKLIIDKSSFKNNSNNGSVQTHKSIYVEAADKRGVAGVSVTNTVGL